MSIGRFGYYAGLISPALLLLGTISVLYVILSQLSYPIFQAIYFWAKPNAEQTPIVHEPTFKEFSSAYTACLLYPIIVAIVSKKNLGVFIRMGSMGAVFVIMMFMFIVGMGIWGIHSTEY